MNHIVVWSMDSCPQCASAMTVLDSYKINYEVRKIGKEWTPDEFRLSCPNQTTVPQILINNKLIGGYANLVKYLEETGE